MSEHTPTPWELFSKNGVFAIVNPRGRSTKREIVFWTGFEASHYPRQAKANAQFIVEAVNSYDDIQELLADLWLHFSTTDDPILRKMVERGRALIPDPVGGSRE